MATAANLQRDRMAALSKATTPQTCARLVPWQELESPDQRLAWDALAEWSSEPNPFHESWYLLAALRALDPQRSVAILRFDHDGELAGLLPLRRENRYYRWPIPHWCNWVHGNCFLGAPLVAAGLEREFWRAVLRWLDTHSGAGLFFHLSQVPLGGPIHAALQAVLDEQGRRASIVHEERRAMLSSPLHAQDYFEASLSGKKRKELRRQHTRLGELGNLAFERRDDEHRLGRWIDDFLALEHSGWKGAAGSALASHHATAQMFREALSGAASRGKLERLTLTLDDEPIAMLANFITPPGAYSYKTAFDERYARFSPGVLLQRENLALLDRGGIDWCDSCAAADHPMIDHIWRERRRVGRLSIAIGGPVRRALFGQLLRAELGRSPTGIDGLTG